MTGIRQVPRRRVSALGPLGSGCLVLCTIWSAENRSAAQLVAQGENRNTEIIAFSEGDEPPADRTVLIEKANEAWYFVPSRRQTRSAIDPQSRAGRGAASQAPTHGEKSPFAVFDKISRKWRTAAMSRHAHEIYPVRADPEDPSLIWFGCNDARRPAIVDGPLLLPSGAVDDPLVFGGHRGGLGLNTKRASLRPPSGQIRR